MAQTFRTESAFEGATPGPHENPPVPIKQRALAALAVKCERCGAPGAKKVPCRTAYADPKENVNPVLCSICEEDYHDMWDEMWADYYSGSGVVHVTKSDLAALRKK